MSAPALLLASASPRRRELLERVGLAFAVHAADLDETPIVGEAPAALSAAPGAKVVGWVESRAKDEPRVVVHPARDDA